MEAECLFRMLVPMYCTCPEDHGVVEKFVSKGMDQHRYKPVFAINLSLLIL